MRQVQRLATGMVVVGLGSLMLWFSPRVHGQATGSQPPSVEARLEAIERRLQDLEKRLDAVAASFPDPSVSGPGSIDAPVGERLSALDGKLQALERKVQSERETALAHAQKTPVVGAGPEGFFLKSAEGDFQLKLRGYLQSDTRVYSDARAVLIANTFILRRVRPIMEGTVFKYFDFRIMPDFGSGQTTLQDLHLDANFWPQARIRVGKYKAPFGLERLQSARNLVFIERALPTNLAPNRDLGLQVYGDLKKGVMSYAVGVFNGVVDGGSSDFDIRDGKDFVGRVFTHPFRLGKTAALRGLGLGLAGSVGLHRGGTLTPNLPVFKTSGQQTFFRYRLDGTEAGTTISDGRHWRVSPQAYYYGGPLGLMAEYVYSSQEVRQSAQAARLGNDSWQMTASYVLTGEEASYQGVAPDRDFDVRAHRFGAFEIAGRYGQLNVDSKAFPVFANPQIAARRARAWAVGLNWYLNRNVKCVLDYEQTHFDGGAVEGNRETERVILNRVQVSF